MVTRLNPMEAAPAAMKQWYDASISIAAGFDPALAELVKIRASQINGCANCINLHTYFARDAGETAQRLDLLAAWREAPCYSDRERAALGWTEALTRIAQEHTHVAAYEALAAYFSEEDRVKLTLLINIINGWNRIAVGFGGWADPAQLQAAAKAAAA